MPMLAIHRIIFYTKPGCHLCDDALDLLLVVSEELGIHPAIEEINILEDPALYAQYKHAIPVIAINPKAGGPILYAPITPSELRQKLGFTVDGPEIKRSTFGQG